MTTPTSQNSLTDQNMKLSVSSMISRTPHLVRGLVLRMVRKNPYAAVKNMSPVHTIRLLFLLNIVLAFALTVSLVAIVLAEANSQLSNSFKVTLTSAVIAIVTSCFLSIGKSLG